MVANKTLCGQKFNNLNQQLKRLLSNIKNAGITSYLENLTDEKDTDYSLLKAAKRVRRPILNAPLIKKNSNAWARSNQEKADVHADHLEKVFQSHLRQTAEEKFVIRDCDNDISITPVLPKEVWETIKHLNAKKAPDHDLITAQMLKELPFCGIMKLTHRFNASFRLRYVPRQWKIAEVITIPKPGKPLEEVTSYRPISLLPIISKVYEKLLLNRQNYNRKETAYPCSSIFAINILR